MTYIELASLTCNKTVLILLLIFSLANCEVKEKVSSRVLIEDFQISTGFIPKFDFMGLCVDQSGKELLYYADPITRKAIYFRDFKDSLWYTIDIAFAADYLEEILGINVISVDSICLLSRKKVLSMNRYSEKTGLIDLQQLTKNQY